MEIKKETLEKIAKTSFAEKALKKKLNIKEKELDKHKQNSLKYGLFAGLFIWLGVGTLTKNILLSAGIGIIASIIIFVLLLQAPLAKKKTYAKKVEAQLPLFLMQLATEVGIGKSFFKAIEDCCVEKSEVSSEFSLVLSDMKKGSSFSEALEQLNKRMDSLTIRRVCSNLSNIQIQGSKDTTSIRKLAQEMLLKQRIESKEFSGKMVVYALVFIAISAIVPAMFQSFILIGSYFMKLSFTAMQVFLISVVLFPIADLAILLIIDSKTPIFLK